MGVLHRSVSVFPNRYRLNERVPVIEVWNFVILIQYYNYIYLDPFRF
jgi:hypothetical protein